MQELKQIVIVGGGFAGIQLARNLAGSNYKIMLIDKLNHHQFQPLFYQVATARIEPSSISFPLRKMFQKQKNVEVRLAQVESVDAASKTISTSIGSFSYDYLVIASGCRTNFFNNVKLAEGAWSMKTTFEAISIRNHLLLNFEKAYNASPEELKAIMNIVVVGAGPTGVELAGALAEMKKYILPKDYPGVDFSALKIYLIEGSATTLSNMSESSKKWSFKYLRKMGVDVLTNTILKDFDEGRIILADGNEILTNSVIWAAGVTGNMIPGLATDLIVRGNRVKVDRFNRVIDNESIYALGDVAYMETPSYPHGHPQVANVAINQAKNLAHNFRSMAKGKKQTEYEYKDLGAMATVGKHKAVVDLPFIKFHGQIAWFVWMFLHLMLILSVRNKFIVFFNWAWTYLTRDTSLRLILRSDPNGKKI